MSWVRVSVAAVFLSVVHTFAVGWTVLAADEKEVATPPTKGVFVPPEIGAPKDRLGAGTRDVSSGTASGSLLLLVPKDGGLATLIYPPLVWKLTRGHKGDIVIGLKPFGADSAQFRIKGPFPAGDYGLDLSRRNISLSTNLIYIKHIALVDQNSGTVTKRAEGLVERLPELFKSDNPTAEGYWFDALAQFVDIGLNGRVRVTNAGQFEQLLGSAGVGP